MTPPSHAPPSVTTWMVQVRWGERRLHAEALDADGRRKLVLGRGAAADVELGIDAFAKLEWTALGLRVSMSPGFRGTASLKDDRAAPLNGLVSRGRATETATGLDLLLEPGDSLQLQAGTLRVDVRPAFLPVRRLPIDVRTLGVLGLALLAVGLVIFSVVV